MQTQPYQTKKYGADELLTIKEASDWASAQLGKNVTTSNISYLIQYGRIKKIGENGFTQIIKQELIDYYKSYNGHREVSWKDQLGQDLNWVYLLTNIKKRKQQNTFTDYTHTKENLYRN